MTLADLFGLYLVGCLVLTGLWNHLDEVPFPIRLFLLVISFWIVGEGRKPVASLGVRPPGGRAIGMGAAIGLLIWLPTLIYFFATYRQEFPLLGDHVHHVATAWNLGVYWREYLPMASGLIVIGALVHWRWRPRGWPILAVAAMILISFVTPLYSPLARYPTGFYSLAAFAQWFREFVPDLSALNANRWVSVLSVGAWLFALRPFLLGLWPDLRILPVALILFFQKDVVYYASTTYLDVPALCLVLLGMEAAWRARQDRPWLGVLICGLAAIFKEQAVLAVPAAWVIAYGWRPTRASLQALAVAVAPFVVYWALRGRSMERPLEPADWERIFTASRLKLYAARLWAQFHAGGLGALGLLFGTVGVHVFRNRARAVLVGSAVVAALAIEVITFVDAASIPWTGYPRYHLIPLGVALFGGLVLGHEWAENRARRRHLIGGIAALALLQLVVLVPALKRELKSDYHRNFVEHFDSPLYFPIHKLVQEGEAAGLLRPGDPPPSLTIQNPVRSPSYGGWVEVGYPELQKRYQLTVDADVRCGCFPDQPAVLVPLTYQKAGIYRDILAATWRGRDLGPCAEQVARSCARSIRAHAPDGTWVGILGAGIR